VSPVSLTDKQLYRLQYMCKFCKSGIVASENRQFKAKFVIFRSGRIIKQFVCTGADESHSSPLGCGVPQGSIVSPGGIFR